MQISARNSLKGTIKSIEPGAVNTQIIIELSNGVEAVSIITKDSAEQLNLAEGKEGLRRRQSERRDDCHRLVFGK